MSSTDPKLPSDGTRVTAMTYDSLEYDREAEEVSGVLTTRPSPFGGMQCWVNNVQVDPATVRTSEDDSD